MLQLALLTLAESFFSPLGKNLNTVFDFQELPLVS